MPEESGTGPAGCPRGSPTPPSGPAFSPISPEPLPERSPRAVSAPFSSFLLDPDPHHPPSQTEGGQINPKTETHNRRPCQAAVQLLRKSLKRKSQIEDHPHRHQAHDLLLIPSGCLGGLDLLLRIDPLPDHPRRILQDLSQGASGSLGNGQHLREIPDILQAAPLSQFPEKSFHRDLQLQLCAHPSQLPDQFVLLSIQLFHVFSGFLHAVFHGISRGESCMQGSQKIFKMGCQPPFPLFPKRLFLLRRIPECQRHRRRQSRQGMVAKPYCKKPQAASLPQIADPLPKGKPVVLIIDLLFFHLPPPSTAPVSPSVSGSPGVPGHFPGFSGTAGSPAPLLPGSPPPRRFPPPAAFRFCPAPDGPGSQCRRQSASGSPVPAAAVP